MLKTLNALNDTDCIIILNNVGISKEDGCQLLPFRLNNGVWVNCYLQ